VKKVLIIDDEEKLRTLLARIVSLEGFDESPESLTIKKKQHRYLPISSQMLFVTPMKNPGYSYQLRKVINQ
jgi:hypothetical protein